MRIERHPDSRHPNGIHGPVAGAALAVVLCFGWPAVAQDTSSPMSAINWLSDSVTQPVAVAMPKAGSGSSLDEPAVTATATPEVVTVTPLGQASVDGIGILPVSVTGLPRNLWGGTASGDIARLVRAERADMMPSLQALLLQLMLAELDPPFDSDARGVLFLARVDKLLEIGALDEAAALLDRAGPTTNPEIFRRSFDTALLTGNEDSICRKLTGTPSLSPTYAARVFCLARNGDWETAALTLGTARALGFISPDEDALLSRFLDPDLYEGEPVPKIVPPVTPLTFRMFEAIGEPLQTPQLPRAFAQADLRTTTGWKAQIEAAERLARAGAISEVRLLALYTERRPAASGGVWERVAAVQNLEAALDAADPEAVGAALPEAYAAMSAAELEPQLARLTSDRLKAITLPEDTAELAFRLALLTPDYETRAVSYVAKTPMDRFLQGLARGDVTALATPDPVAAAIADGLAATEAPIRARSLLDQGRTGEAVLKALDLVTLGATGELDELSDGIALLRALGMETVARRVALEILVLDRRG